MAGSLIIWTLRHRNLKEIWMRVVDLLGYLLIPIGALMPRKRTLWVFGNKTGFNDNSKYLFLHVTRNYPDIQAIWIARNKNEQKVIKALGLKSYERWSFCGVWYCLRAKYYIYSCATNDINYWTSIGAVKINLWHGVGIKKLGLKQSDVYNPKDKLNRFLTPAIYDSPTYFITTSELMTQHFKDCYALTDAQTQRIGYPRCDFLRANESLIDEYISTYESKEIQRVVQQLKKYQKVYVYMPTFRDDQSDYIAHSGINFAELNEIMANQKALFLVKLHPATRTAVQINDFSNIIVLDKSIDIYPILPKTDVLITDYSSIYYDYQLMPDKHVLLFPFDYSDYIQHSRDLAYDYNEYTPGHKYQTWDELKEAIMNISQASSTLNDWVIDMFWGENYKNASEKIIHLISRNYDTKPKK